MVLCFELNRVPFSLPGCWLGLAILHSYRGGSPCLAGISLRVPGALPCLMPCPTPHSACFGTSDWAQPAAESWRAHQLPLPNALVSHVCVCVSLCVSVSVSGGLCVSVSLCLCVCVCVRACARRMLRF